MFDKNSKEKFATLSDKKRSIDFKMELDGPSAAEITKPFPAIEKKSSRKPPIASLKSAAQI